MNSSTPHRFVGLDIHKAYLVAVGVNAQREVVYGPHRVPNERAEKWIATQLTAQDSVILEMTTNSWHMVDLLRPQVQSVTVVHPPHARIITRAAVKTDTKAAHALAEHHAVGLLPGVWIPPQEVRDLRGLVAERTKMRRLATQAKNRLHAVMHRHHFVPPDEKALFHPDNRLWWQNLPVSALAQVQIRTDLRTLDFAEAQIADLDEALAEAGAQDERVPVLVQLPGVALLAAVTLLAAIGDITRFPSAEKLVGYAGLGTYVHISGTLHQTGKITKSGRKDLRWTMVEAAQHAIKMDGHWKHEYERLAPRIGKHKAKVAIARKLLVGVWYVLTYHRADRFASDVQVACSLFKLAYDLRVRRLANGMSALQFTRHWLDKLAIGKELTVLPWGSKQYKLPPSALL